MAEKKIYVHHERDSEAGAVADVQTREIVYASDIGYLMYKNAAGNVRYVATKNSASDIANLQRLYALIAEGQLVWSVLGDSTEVGVSAGGAVYGECTIEKGNGWPNWIYYYIIKADPSFVSLDGGAYAISEAFLANSYAVNTPIEVPYPSWQGTKVLDPTITFNATSTSRENRDKFTIYVNERTADGAPTFRLTVKKSSNLAVLYQGTVDTYVAAETYGGGVGSVGVEGRLAKRTVTLSAAERNLTVTIDQILTVDRGSGVAADGTLVVFGSALGNGQEFHNLAVSSTTLKNASAANVSRGITTTERLGVAQGYSSNVYSIGFATNDSKAGVSDVDTFRSEYKTLIDDIYTGEPDALIIVNNDPRGSGIYANNPEYNAVVKDIAKEYGFLFLDVQELSDSLDASFYADDVHPSGTGTYQLAQAFANLIGIDENTRIEATSLFGASDSPATVYVKNNDASLAVGQDDANAKLEVADGTSVAHIAVGSPSVVGAKDSEVGSFIWYCEDPSNSSADTQIIGEIRLLNDGGTWDGTVANMDTRMEFYLWVNGVSTKTLTLHSSGLIESVAGVTVGGVLTSSGGRVENKTRITSADSPYTALSTDEVIFADTDGGAITINLPAGSNGVNYQIANVGSSANDVTVDGDAAETINGNADHTLTDGKAIQIVFGVTEKWIITGGY